MRAFLVERLAVTWAAELADMRLRWVRLVGVRAGDGGQRGDRPLTHSASASPIWRAESSWTRWMPGTVISRWLGQVRQNCRCAPVRVAPGSALTNSFGIMFSAIQLP